MNIGGCFYPTNKMNPSADTPEKAKENPQDLDYSCQYCEKYGIKYFNESLEDEYIIVMPCSICAMNNGGVWGWKKREDDTYEKLKTCGMLPGKDSISDPLLKHIPSPPKRESAEPLMEEIILGYVQHALYFNMRWNDIIDREEGPSKDHGRPSNSFYRGGLDPNVWHWWKLIRIGSFKSSELWEGECDIFDSKLPKRFCKRLKEIIIQTYINVYDENEHGTEMESIRGNLPWEEFWNTEVEPRDVVVLYRYTMGLVLNRHVDYNLRSMDDEVDNGVPCEDYGIIDYTTSCYNSMNCSEYPHHSGYSERAVRWLHDHVDPNDFGSVNTPLCDPKETADHYLVKRAKIENNSYFEVVELMEIHDHDLFGCSLSSIINFEREWYIDHGSWSIVSSLPRYDRWGYIEDRKNNYCFNLRLQLRESSRFDNIITLEEFIKHSVISELTYQEIDTNITESPFNLSDYSTEYNFRLEFLRNNGAWNPPNPNDTYVDFENIEFEIYSPNGNIEEYEVEEDNDEITDEKKKELRDNLMKLQNIIEEDVKGEVSEGVYLKMMENLKDFYDLLR